MYRKPITKDQERAMIEAHKEGMRAAGDNVSRANVNARAQTMDVPEADAYLAGYYQELRRLARH